MTGWKKIFAYHVSDKGLVSKIYKQTLSKFKVKTNKNQVIQLESGGRGGFHQKDIQMAHRYKKNFNIISH